MKFCQSGIAKAIRYVEHSQGRKGRRSRGFRFWSRIRDVSVIFFEDFSEEERRRSRPERECLQYNWNFPLRTIEGKDAKLKSREGRL